MQRQFDEVRRALDDLERSSRQFAESRRQDLIRALSPAFRRLRQSRGTVDFTAALLDAAAPFCSRAIIFNINRTQVEWQAARGFEVAPAAPFALTEAAAFHSAVESKDVTITLATSQEISPALTHILGEDAGRRATLVPILAMDRVPAILYAEDADTAGLELVCVMAGAALDARKQDSALTQIASGNAIDGRAEDLRARRLARKLAAEIRLAEASAVKAGRAAGDLYGQEPLRARIAAAREAYRNQFPSSASTRKDFLHEELLLVLANGNPDLLGPAYPGPLFDSQEKVDNASCQPHDD